MITTQQFRYYDTSSFLSISKTDKIETINRIQILLISNKNKIIQNTNKQKKYKTILRKETYNIGIVYHNNEINNISIIILYAHNLKSKHYERNNIQELYFKERSI